MMERKAWGEVNHLVINEAVALSDLRVLSGTRCSLHMHRERANLFWVRSGRLVIEERAVPDGQPSFVLLVAGDIYTVPSMRWHRFRVIEGGHIVEVYWPENGGRVYFDDIHRHDVGGEDDLADLRGAHPYFFKGE
jgi:mannose-6-phosphate isomerase-like protein (cupin superfamily)